jgi:predicted  nucleic acid-binding Zn-ribbon protein
MVLQINILEHSILLMSPRRLKLSAWFEHIPFAFFLMEVLKPAIFVELGTYSGVSYCAFCQAVLELHLNTSCYAIDSWKGDPHNGYYVSEILADLQEHHDPLYGSFSCLIQTEFDQALQNFNNGTIDLLHIDGYHTYEAVKHDFEVWLPKMSNKGVIIFHDINVRERDFGVWQLWNELKCQYHNFEFLHGHGLGVLAVGMEQPENFRELLNASEYEATKIRNFFSKVGYGWKVRFSQSQNQEELAQSQKRLQTTQGELEQSQAQLHQTEGLLEQSQAQLHQTEGLLEQSQSQLHQTQSELQECKNVDAAELVNLQTQFQQLQTELQQAKLELEQCQHEKNAIFSTLEQSQSQLHQTEGLLEQSQSQLHQTQSELQECKEELSESQTIAEQLQEKLHQTHAVLEQSQGKQHETQTELAQTKSQLYQSRWEEERMRFQFNQTQTELANSKSEIHQTKAEVEQTKAEVEQTKAEVEQTKAEVEQTQTALDKIQRLFREAQSQIHQLHKKKSELKRVYHQFYHLQGEFEQSQSQLYHNQQELEQLKSQFSQTQVELEQLKSQFSQTQVELEQLKSQFSQTQVELEQLKSQFSQTQVELVRTRLQHQYVTTEPQSKTATEYKLLVWDAWYAYQSGDLKKMQQCLQESLKCTPLSRTEAVVNWIENFSKFSLDNGYPLETKSLTNSAEWKQLTRRLSGTRKAIIVQ